jgi:hypothetical protein
MATSVGTTRTLDRLNMLIKQNKTTRLQEEYILLEVANDSVMERFRKRSWDRPGRCHCRQLAVAEGFN